MILASKGSAVSSRPECEALGGVCGDENCLTPRAQSRFLGSCGDEGKFCCKTLDTVRKIYMNIVII